MKFTIIIYCIFGVFVNTNLAAFEAEPFLVNKEERPCPGTQSAFVERDKSHQMQSAEVRNITSAYPIITQLLDDPEYSECDQPSTVEHVITDDPDLEDAFWKDLGLAPSHKSYGRSATIPISFKAKRAVSFPKLSLDPCAAKSLSSDDDDLVVNRSDTEQDCFGFDDNEFFNCEHPFTRVESPVSGSDDEELFKPIASRCVTVTHVSTNRAVSVPLCSLSTMPLGNMSTNVTNKSLYHSSATPINTVPRNLRPCTRTKEGRLKEAQINHMLPIRFVIHPKTGEEIVVFKRTPKVRIKEIET